MAIVVDGLQLISSKRRLPKEAFFVDTNVVIDFKDPFGRTNEDKRLRKRHESIITIISVLKSMGAKAYGSLSVVLEYYKNMQVGYYRVQPGKDAFDLADFKRLRDSASEFSDGWKLQMESMKKTFRRNFPLYDISLSGADTLWTFTGTNADFGDHLLFKTVMKAPEKMWCIFSNDGDFYSFPDELFLLTTNDTIIKKAEKENKLYKPVST